MSATLSRWSHQGFPDAVTRLEENNALRMGRPSPDVHPPVDLAPKATPTLRLKRAHIAKSDKGAAESPGEVRCRSKAVFPAIIAGEQMVDLFGDARSAQLLSKPCIV
jgi:hypothetical protein